MQLQGICVSEGAAVGRLLVYEPYIPQVPAEPIGPDRVEAECGFAAQAVRKALEQLRRQHGLLDNARKESRGILGAHIAILEDETLLDGVQNLIRGEYLCAMAAIDRLLSRLGQRMARAKDPVMRQRASDFQDIRLRLLGLCQGREAPSGLSLLEEPVVIAARDLLPSDTVSMDASRVLAILTQEGGYTSHSAIIARSLGIPAVSGLEGLLEQVSGGQTVLVEADSGRVVANPTDRQTEEFSGKVRTWEERKQLLKTYLERPCALADGTPIDIGRNIGSDRPGDLGDGRGVDFVGLLRSEFLYMDNTHFPGEEEQLAAYLRVLQAHPGKSVVLRTLDIGGDKSLPYFAMPEEPNPFLGNRAIRFCFSHPDIFRTQLRAALRAGAQGDVWLMLPMVSSLEELRRAKEMIAQAKQELRREGLPFREDMPVGVMIEIPSLALMASQVAQEADFASIGSNDLCQYLLAADRMNPAVQKYYQMYHPALLRLIRMTVEAFHQAGKPISLCGELAGVAQAAPVLAGLGLRKLSMNLSSVPGVKQALSQVTLEQCRTLAEQVLSCGTAREAAGKMGINQP